MLGNALQTQKKDVFQEPKNRPIKVCQLCSVDFTLRHFLLPLIDSMEARGWHVTSVCSEGVFAQELRVKGYSHRAIAFSRNWLNLAAHLRSIVKIYIFLRGERFDVLHVHTPIGGILGRIAGKLAGVPLIVYTAHGFYFHDAMPKLRYRFFVNIERICGGLTDFLFTQSQEDGATAIKEHIANSSSVAVIGNGVSSKRFSFDQELRAQTRSRFGFSDDTVVIGITARMVREKGIIEFLEAAMRLRSMNDNISFLMIGERLPSDYDSSVDQRIHKAKLALGSRLILVGYTADVRANLAAMDLFCLPSYREGLPRSIIEAMMMSLPVIATNIRGPREQVVHGVTGLLVPLHDVSALVDGFATLSADSGLRDRMGRAARIRAIELFEEEHVVQKQIEIIDTLISEK
ncbi:MAG: glycosyltransferase family 4 protein [Betaproteobacteria bacterium]